MKASEIIDRLTTLMEKHGDLEVGLYADHEPALSIAYNSKSWVVWGLGDAAPAFEFNGYGDVGDGE